MSAVVERRRAERVRVNLDIVFNDQQRQQKGTISDISVTGCFILSAGATMAAAPVTVLIRLPSEKTIQLTGEVVYNTPEIGFAIRFVELPKSARHFLEKLVKRFSQAQRQPNGSSEH